MENFIFLSSACAFYFQCGKHFSNTLIVFDHFVGLVLKELTFSL